MNATITIETVTPSIARQWLNTRFDKQRSMRQSHVSRLASAMKRGEWRLGSDAIVMICGQLANGQHRLQAVSESDRPCKFLVLRTDDGELYSVMDCGIGRTTGDVAHMIGASNGNLVAAVVRWKLLYERGAITATSRADNAVNQITRGELVSRIAELHNTISADYSQIAKEYEKQRLFSPSLPCALMQMVDHHHRPMCMEFIKACYTGSDVGAPSYLLQHRMIANLRSTAKLSSTQKLMLLAKAWVAHRDRTVMRNLKLVEGESFPKV